MIVGQHFSTNIQTCFKLIKNLTCSSIQILKIKFSILSYRYITCKFIDILTVPIWLDMDRIYFIMNVTSYKINTLFELFLNLKSTKHLDNSYYLLQHLKSIAQIWPKDKSITLPRWTIHANLMSIKQVIT